MNNQVIVISAYLIL